MFTVRADLVNSKMRSWTLACAEPGLITRFNQNKRKLTPSSSSKKQTERQFNAHDKQPEPHHNTTTRHEPYVLNVLYCQRFELWALKVTAN